MIRLRGEETIEETGYGGGSGGGEGGSSRREGIAGTRHISEGTGTGKSKREVEGGRWMRVCRVGSDQIGLGWVLPLRARARDRDRDRVKERRREGKMGRKEEGSGSGSGSEGRYSS